MIRFATREAVHRVSIIPGIDYNERAPKILNVGVSGAKRLDSTEALNFHLNGERSMNKPFTAIAAIVYAGLAIGHVVRAITSAEFIIAGVAFPAWVSWPAAGLATLLACMLWREMKR